MECRPYGCVCALTAIPVSLDFCHFGQGIGLLPWRPGFDGVTAFSLCYNWCEKGGRPVQPYKGPTG